MNADLLNCASSGYGADIVGVNQGGTITDPQMWENFLKAARDFKYAQAQMNITANDGGHNLYEMIKKGSIEAKFDVGSVHAYFDHRDPAVWDNTSKTTVDAYCPALDLSAITGSQTIDSTGTSSGLSLSPITKLVAPALVTWLRARKLTIRRGMTSPKDAFTLSTYQLTSNVVTLTFASDSDLVAALNMLLENGLAEGASADLLTYTPDYTKSFVINIPSALGAISAGDYTITAINSPARTVTFAFTNANIGSTASSVQCSFYPCRIVGSSTTARITAVQGRALVGANDGLLENAALIKRRGRMHGHYHGTSGTFAGSALVAQAGSGVTAGSGTNTITGPITDGTNGTPRTGPETDVRNISMHFHLGLGALEA